MDNSEDYPHEPLEPETKLFFSPIQEINAQPHNTSPSEVTIEFCNSRSFKKIVEKQNEDEIQSEYANGDTLYDLQGNAICEFNTFDDLLEEYPVLEDKENEVQITMHMQTPLKNKQLRSPLKDITPSITKRKKKSAMRTISQKSTYLTPRTMAESRFSGSSGLRRIQRL